LWSVWSGLSLRLLKILSMYSLSFL
jgi:hypothetical protein